MLYEVASLPKKIEVVFTTRWQTMWVAKSDPEQSLAFRQAMHKMTSAMAMLKWCAAPAPQNRLLSGNDSGDHFLPQFSTSSITSLLCNRRPARLFQSQAALVARC
jgi:hypothetical protein